MNSPARRLERVLLGRPRSVLALTALLTLLALTQLFNWRDQSPRFSVDPSMDALLPSHGAALERYRRVQATFGDDDLLLVAWLTDDLFTPPRLAALQRLTQTLAAVPGVVRIDSLATAPDVQEQGEDTTQIAPWLAVIPTTQDQLAALRARAISHPLLRGQLVSADGRAALLALRPARDLSPAALAALVEAVRHVSRAATPDGLTVVTGPVLVRSELGAILQRDLFRVTPLAAVFTLAVAALTLRSRRGMLLPLFANGAAVLITLALFVACGQRLDFVTVILPPVVYVVGFAYAVHVISDFERLHTDQVSRAEAALAALREACVPVTLTALTTAIGFLALAASPTRSISAFGLFAALGTGLSWLAALCVVPAGLACMPGAPRPAPAQAALRRRAQALAHFNLRHARAVLVTAVVVTLGALLLATRIEVDTRVLDNFADQHAVKTDFARVARVFAGAVPLQIVLDSSAADTWRTPEAQRALSDLVDWLEAQPEVGGVYSLVDVIDVLFGALAPARAAAGERPDSARLLGHLLLLGGDVARPYVDADYRSTLIDVRTRALSTAAVNALVTRIEARLAQLPPEMQGAVTGLSALGARSVDTLTWGQMNSLGGALLGTFVVLSALFGSWRAGLLALVPNVLPMVFYFGLLGACSITLNLTTSLVAAAVFGITVDDTVVFMSRYALEARRYGPGAAAVEATLAAILRPATLTTLALCAGFLALTTAELHSQVEFGALAAATLAFAWLLDMTVTPVLCRNARFVLLWERPRPWWRRR